MSEFEQDYDKGIDRFLGRFWDKKRNAKGNVLDRIRQVHKRDTSSSTNFFEEISGGDTTGADAGAGTSLFRQTVDIPVKYRCQVPFFSYTSDTLLTLRISD